MSLTRKYLVALDDGHGMETAGKRTPIFTDGTTSPDTGKNFMHENEFNRAVVAKLGTILQRCGIDTLLVAPTDEDTPLTTRVSLANSKNADIYVSVHANAYDGKFDGNDPEGVEVYCYPNSKNGIKLANAVYKHLLQGTKQVGRGVKQSTYFYVLRATKMPSILIECAFMDNPREAKLLLSDAFREECAIEIAKGICEYFGMPYIEEELPSKPEVTNLYRVRKSWEDVKSQIGAFSVLANAIALAKQNAGYKVYDGEGNQVYPNVEEVIEEEDDNNVKIMGEPEVTAEQMAKFLLMRNKTPKINLSALEFAEIFLEEGRMEGVRGDIAFCQSMHETGWLNFGGQVLPEQHNYAGIGATNNSPVGKGAWFTDEREGIRAQIQHLKAYASKEPLVNDCVDPRFNLVTRGIAPYWTDLNGRWAVPGTTYGQKILALYEELKNVYVTPEEAEELREDKTEEQVKELEAKIKELNNIINEKEERIKSLETALDNCNAKLKSIKDIVLS